ncbi:MAG: glycerol-3-phosphate dehydrogenase [Gemmataceae bacterium]
MRRDLDRLAGGTFDLLILGGGITGAGVALDAVLRGLKVALIDKGDFASGTSSVSSKLVHGGLRYLEHAQLSLVREALTERGRLLRNAPHLVQPLRFLLPFYRGARVAPWQWRAALTLYDLLAGRANIRRSRPVTSHQLLRECPVLCAAGLRAGAQYFDAQMDDARLCLEVILTAARQGACVANYVEATAFEMANGAIHAVRAVDRHGGRELRIAARLVLNATGPWVDRVAALAGDPAGPRLQVTKGVHIIVADQKLPAAFLLLHPRDGRVFFVLPWLGKTLLGTTDTFTPEDADHLSVQDADIDYLLEGWNRHFTRPLSRPDVLGYFAGLRPLLRSTGASPSARSRQFRLFTSPSGLLSAAGGKYTTYRSMARQITDEICRRLGVRRPCRTADFRLLGAPAEPWADFVATATPRLMGRHGLSETAALHLLRRYGLRAIDVAARIQRPEDSRPVSAGEPDLEVELAYQRECEMALTHEDVLFRRTRLGLFQQHASLARC